MNMSKIKFTILEHPLFNHQLAKLSPKISTPLLIIAFVFTNVFFVHCQVKKTFTQRTSKFSPSTTTYHINGDYTMIGNSNMTLQNYSDSKNNGSSNTMKKVDKDADATTNNSSSSTLTFSSENGAVPSCSNILFAGLYWTGRTDYSVITTDKQKVKIKCPGQSNYQQLTANVADILYPGSCNNINNCDNNNIFSAYIEVTDLVRQYGLGEYWVANIALSTSNQDGIGWSGGWGMIVVYENSKMKQRDVTIFDGFAFVTNSTTVSYDLPVAGFNTVLSGPVNMKLGMMASEGDVGYTGDYFKIKQNSNSVFLALSHPDNSGNTSTDYSDNFFSSTIYTGGNARNPNLANNTGIDINMFTIPNTNNSVIGNNQTSTTFKYGSTVDTYVIFCIAMGVDAYRPVPEGIISSLSPSATLYPCDETEYKVEIRNKGTEALENAKIIIPLPYTAMNYISSSKIVYSPAFSSTSPYFDPSMGAAGSIVWDFGTLPKPADPNTLLAELTFKLGISCDCNILKANGCSSLDVTINGNISGIGAETNVAAENPFILGYATSGICIGTSIHGPITNIIDAASYISAHCMGVSVREFTFCNEVTSIPVSKVSGNFPLGSRFYNEYPVTETSIEYTSANPFPATTGTVTYYAYPPGNTGCYYTFKVTVATINSVPILSSSPVSYCQNAVSLPLIATTSNPAYTLYYYTSNSSSAIPQLEIIPSTENIGNTTYYISEGNGSYCISPNKIPITVSVNPLPSPPSSVYSDRNNFCPNDNGNINLSAVGGSGITLNWFAESCGSASIGNGTPLTIPSPEVNTTYFVRWENNCGFSSCIQLPVNVEDNINPQISCIPSQIKCANTLNNTYKVSGNEFDAVSFSDNCSVSVVYNNINNTNTLSGAEFAKGLTNVIWTVKDAAGNMATCSFDVTVKVPPVVNSNTGNKIKCLNDSVMFKISASGTAPLFYQWRKNGTNIISATNSQFIVLSSQITDAGSYTCIVTNSCGIITSNPASLVINIPPSVTTQPINQSVCPSSGASFSVTAVGTAPFIYQWRKNGTNITSATNSQLSFANCQSADAGNYTCIISNTCGAITGNPASLDIYALPSITVQPLGQSVCPSTNVIFSVSATGTAPLNYQWRKNGTNITSATNSQFSILNSQLVDAAGYSCVISNSCGNITSNTASLVIYALPSITVQPLSQSVCPSANVIFSVNATGYAPLNYQWRKNGTNIISATTSQFSILNSQLTDVANYTCIVSNSCGNITSNIVALALNTLPSITVQPLSQTVCPSTNVVFSVSAAGTNPLFYQWRKNGINILPATNSQFSILNSQLTDVTGYSCVVTNMCNSVTTNTALLSLYNPPVINSITNNKIKCVNDSALFKVSASGTAPLNYQWRKDNTDILAATNSQFSILNCQLADQGSYSCNVVNICGNIIGNTMLSIKTLPAIQIPITNQTKCEGFDISFNISATGSDLNYQWTKGGVNILNATNSILTLTNLRMVDANIYSCVVKNSCSSQTLKPFLLLINQKPRINIVPITQIKNVGDSVSYYLNPQGTAPFIYQWIKNNTVIPGATLKNYRVTYLTIADAGVYNCIVNNVCGTSTMDISTLIIREGKGSGYMISGNVNYDNITGTPMKNTMVYLKSTEEEIIDSTMTDLYGEFVFNNIENGTYNINCKTSLRWGGADPTDALLINQYFVKMFTFRDNLLTTAGDVNLDTRVNSTDALIINKRFVKLVPSFNAGDWIFENTAVNVADFDIGCSVKAVCVGDVNGSYTPIAKKTIEIPIRHEGEINIKNNQLAEIPLRVSKDVELGAFGLIIKINKELYDVIAVKSDINNMFSNNSDELIKVAWSAENKALKLKAGDTLLKLIVRVKDLKNIENYMDLLINSESVIADFNADVLNYNILSTPKPVLNNTQSLSLTCYPNPMKGISTVNYQLSDDSHVDINLYNVIGQKIKTILSAEQTKGAHSVKFDALNIDKGLYFIKINVSGKSALEKIVLVDQDLMN